MSQRDSRHVRGRLYRWLPVAVVLALLVAAGAAYRFDVGERWFDVEPTAPADKPGDGPADVAPPPGLELPTSVPAGPVAEPAVASPLDRATVRRAIGRQFQNPEIGKRFSALVAPLADGGPALSRGDGVLMPASTLKLLTAAAALSTIDAGTRFATTVVQPGPRRIVLVGGGDPYLASRPTSAADRARTYPARADVVTLARRTANALKKQGTSTVRLSYDDSLFSGPVASPGWEPTYLPEAVVAPITALWVDRGVDDSGFGRVSDPSLRAAQVYAAALAKVGIRVTGALQRAKAPGAAGELARVESAPVEQIVQHVLDVSDNEGAEVLGHQVGLASDGDGSFAGGVRGVTTSMRSLGVDMSGAILHDGSGLSRQDRLRPQTLVDVLRVAADPARPELRPVLEGLPVAGFTGSLADRFAEGDPAGGGRVRVKTGTLTGVRALAGLVSDLDGNLMVLVMIANGVPADETRDAKSRLALEKAAASLAGCHCGSAA
ncbi:D-alanyl-D-alanine carboxypeptidase/D-alanyl-D-alanine-endopeptidase [metagenome]|uniref:D-alanyl-D-alanine carboxypeptidase/D-alanyl-D-alanine-endopeptidase n=1 Tax=metagenome TaxID=256318 RepID=A0A2P2CF18_9ZZZZ